LGLTRPDRAGIFALSNLVMKMKKNNVLILDPAYVDKSVLREILVKNGFHVHICVNEPDAINAIDTFKPDIILCRASARMIQNSTLLCGFHDRAKYNHIPYAVVTSGADVDFFLKGLERGLTHAITAPFNGEFLVTRVREIIEGESGGSADERPVSMNVSYRGSDYSLSLQPSQLSRFIVSMLQDTVSHSSTLSDMIQKRNALHSRICRADLFDGIRSKTEEELILEKEVNDALDRKEFSLQYQPIVSFGDGHVNGFEALVRWNHPARGIIMPTDFIPTVERSPLIIPLGFWIIDEAVRQVASWRKSGVMSRPMHVGINLSASQFVHPELGASIAGILKKHAVQPENVAFEITESAFMMDMESANVQLLKLKSGRHSIYMDDFGTGYSSLSYLQHFPVDSLKIDRSFVRWMHEDEQSEHIVRSIVGLAHNLGLKVVAEGVEEAEHRRMLGELACDYGQGYLFSRPLDAKDATDFLRNS